MKINTKLSNEQQKCTFCKQIHLTWKIIIDCFKKSDTYYRLISEMNDKLNDYSIVYNVEMILYDYGFKRLITAI